jgi:hypothetical protein
MTVLERRPLTYSYLEAVRAAVDLKGSDEVLNPKIRGAGFH